jgi:hypothetical protein
MNYDNPAASLFNIIEAGAKLDKGMACYQAWQQLLGLTDNDSIILINRLGKVMALPNECAQLIQLHHPALISTIATWKPPLEQAFFNQVLGGRWETFVQYIQPYVISQLAELAHAKSGRLAADSTAIEKAIAGLDELLKDIESSDLSSEIKIYLTRELNTLRMNLSEHRITGSSPAIRQAESIVGHAHRDKAFWTFLTSHTVGQRVLDNLNVVVGVLNIYVATAQISAPGFALLGN